MSDLDAARREAEEALAEVDDALKYIKGDPWEPPAWHYIGPRLTIALRALHAATTPAALRLPDGVREAAEELRAYLPVWINGGLGEDGQLRYRIEDLLAALDADPWQTARLGAEAALTMLADRPCVWEGSEQHDYCAKALTANVCSPCIARRYFAHREGEKGEPNG